MYSVISTYNGEVILSQKGPGLLSTRFIVYSKFETAVSLTIESMLCILQCFMTLLSYVYFAYDKVCWVKIRRSGSLIPHKKVAVKVKGRCFRGIVRPVMLSGLEMVALTQRQETELEVAESKMLRFSLSVPRVDRIRNEPIRRTAQVRRSGDKVREARVRRFGRVVKGC